MESVLPILVRMTCLLRSAVGTKAGRTLKTPYVTIIECVIRILPYRQVTKLEVRWILKSTI